MSSKKKNVKKFKEYLSKKNPVIGRLYFGGIDHEFDEGFEAALKAAEKKVSKAINSSIEGQLFSNGSLNPLCSVEDLDRSLGIISKANATMDSLGPPDGDVPSAMNFSNTPPGYEQEVDPADTQQTGATEQAIPKVSISDIDWEKERESFFNNNKKKDVKDNNIDNRMVGLVDLIKNVEKS